MNISFGMNNKNELSVPNYDGFGDCSSNKGFVRRYIYMPDKPFRMLICGKSGCGKTNLLMHILLKPLIQYDKIYLYSKSLEQEKLKCLRKRFEEVSEKVGYEVMVCSNDEVVPLDELPSNNQKLVIFDDYMCEKNKDRLIEYFIRGRNRNCRVIYLSQSFYKTPKDIRLNCSHFCLFDV